MIEEIIDSINSLPLGKKTLVFIGGFISGGLCTFLGLLIYANVGGY